MKLWHYIQGSRKGIEAHEVEKEAMRDPFLADALAGYEIAKGNPQRKVARLQKEINKRQKRAEGAPETNSTKRVIWIAAIVVIILVAAAALYLTTIEPLPIRQQAEEPQSEAATEPMTEPMTEPVQEETKEAVVEEVTPAVPEPVKPSIAPTSLPQPEIGMADFEAYIKRNLKHPTDEECRDVKGEVVVTFKIGQSGRPYNIRVNEGLCASINQEAIRLIINGPDWIRGTDTDEMNVTIAF